MSMELQEALKISVKEACNQRNIARGLNECARALDQRKAVLCLLANNCNEANYIKLVEALCAEHQIPLVKVDSNEMLGQWVGLCKYDEEGEARKVVKCSCAVITAWGPESEAQKVVKSSQS
jgi:small subunit ribosomal protein S12e